MSKVVFLDVDGVINNGKTKERSPERYVGIEDDLVKLVKEIVEITDSIIVLSSSWRGAYIKNEPDGLYLKNKLEKQGLSISDFTEMGEIKQDRGEQIRKYVDSHKEISHFAILDDEFIEFFIRYNLQNNLVATDPKIGLTHEDVEKAIKILNNK